MNAAVVLRHPSLPVGQTITVDRRRIGPRLASGWEEVPDKPAETEPAESSTQDNETEPSESAPKRRVRKSEEQ